MSWIRSVQIALAALAAVPAFAPALRGATPSTADSIGYVSTITSANRVAATLTNYGVIGNNFASRAASLEYPYGTGYEHLPHGGLWFGAHAVDSAGAFVGVATGCLDVPQGTSTRPLTEFTPAGNAFLERSSIDASPFYDPGAVSEQDLVCWFSDQPAKYADSNPEIHRPLDILVRQESYAWSWPNLEDVLFVRFSITNTGTAPLTDAWVGLYTELASGPKNSYSCWPPSSVCSTIGGWFSKKWLQYEDSLRMVREHYCAAQPVPSGCLLSRVPYWMGVQLLTPPDAQLGQSVTLAAWSYSPANPLRDQDVERYAIMSAGTIVPFTGDSLLPQSGDPVELLALGPFPAIGPGDSIHVDFALVGGADEAEIHRHAVYAQWVYDAGYDATVTPTLPSLASADAEPGRVRLVWQGAAGAALRATIERREPAGDWAAIAEGTSDGLGRIAYEDVQVAAGRRYGYRLALRAGGGVAYAGETWVEVPGAATLALQGLRPNPASRGVPVVAFSLADDGPATIEAFDVAGRRVWSRALAGLGAGSHIVPIESARTLVPGIYLLRLTQGARVVTARAAVTR